MNRREFVKATGIVAAGSCLAGCPGGGTGDDSPSVIEGGDADVSTTVVRDAPEELPPYEDSLEPVVPEEGNALVLRNLVFQRAGERGLVVSGEAINTGDRALEAVVLTVVLYDLEDATNDVEGSERVREEREGLDAGSTWQWAATFSITPDEIDTFSVEAIGNYE